MNVRVVKYFLKIWRQHSVVAGQNRLDAQLTHSRNDFLAERETARDELWRKRAAVTFHVVHFKPRQMRRVNDPIANRIVRIAELFERLNPNGFLSFNDEREVDSVHRQKVQFVFRSEEHTSELQS